MDLCTALWAQLAAQLTERLKEQPKLLEMLDKLQTLLEKPIVQKWYVFSIFEINLKLFTLRR